MERYLDVKAAATYLGLTKKALYHRVYRRQIPFCKPPHSRTLRFDSQALDRWMRRGEVDATAVGVSVSAAVQSTRAIAE